MIPLPNRVEGGGLAIDPTGILFGLRGLGPPHDELAITIHAPDGTILDDSFVILPTAGGPDTIVFGPFHPVWNGDLFQIGGGGELYRITSDGQLSLFGTGFGVATGLTFGPDRSLYVASLSDNVIYRIFPSDRIQNPDNNHWYQRFDNIMTWHEAKAHCENLGGYLATITSLNENLFVYDMASVGDHRVWLGATDEETEGLWKWITGETWAFTNWVSGEPNNYENEDYLEMYGWSSGSEPEDKGLWNDLHNSGYGDFALCEWGPPQLCQADIDNDGDVDGADLGVLAVEFGRTDCH